MLESINVTLLRWWATMTLPSIQEEDGAESAEYLAMTAVMIILLVLVGKQFEEHGREVVGEPLLDLIGKIIRAAGGWIS